MPSVPCSVCNMVYDSEDFTETQRHNKHCPVYLRMAKIYSNIETEDNLDRALDKKLEANKQKQDRLNILQPDVIAQTLSNGAYTGKLLQGLSSDEISLKFSSTMKSPSWHLHPSKIGICDFSNTSSATKRKNMTNDCVEKGTMSESNNSSSSFSRSQMLRYDRTEAENCVMEDNMENTLPTDDDIPIMEDNEFGADDNLMVMEDNHALLLAENRKKSCRSVLIDTDNANHANTSLGIVHSETEKALIQLVSHLASVNAPYHLYGKIVKWAKELKPDVLNMRSITYKTLVHQTAMKYGLDNIFPKCRELLLPSRNAVLVTKFNFSDQLFSLLSDESLMKPENLIYGDDIFSRETEHTNTHVFNDVNTSTWFLRTQKSMCVNKEDILVPIILYIDKTHVRAKCAEAISITLGIFKRNIRSTAMAWRNLGMIPGKLGDLVPNKKFLMSTQGEMRLNDWHCVANYLLSDLKDLQKLDGLDWNIFGKKCRLRIPIMFIIGDIEGHDKICSRKSGHNKKMKGVTHSCKVRRNECGFVETECQYFSSNEVKSRQDVYQNVLSTDEEKEEAYAKLYYLGFYSNVRNAFFDLDYGVSEYGTHGAVAICLLHTFKQKFPNSVMDKFINIFGKSNTAKGAVLVNKSAPRLIQQCIRQSDRSFPKLNTFTVSLWHAKFQLSANEKYSRMFALSLYCMSTYGWESTLHGRNTKVKDESVVKKRIKLIEMTLTIYKFMAQENFHIRNKYLGNTSVMRYMSLYKEVLEWEPFVPIAVELAFEDNDYEGSDGSIEEESEVDSVEDLCDETSEEENTTEEVEEPVMDGDLCTFPKYHYLKHVCDMISRFGSALNFDGGFCESNHKYLTKAPGMRTQGRTDNFDEQTSFNLSAKIVMDRAFRNLKLETSQGVSTHFNSIPIGTITRTRGNVTEPGVVSINRNSSRFVIINNDDGIPTIEWKKGLVKPRHGYPEIALTALKKLLVPGFPFENLTGFTCLNWNDELIHAHPSYRSKTSWYDHVNVVWDGKQQYICPSKVYMFLDLKNHPDPHMVDGLYAIVHSTAVNPVRERKPTSDAVRVWRERGSSNIFQFWTMEQTCHCVNVAFITSTAFVCPDFDDEDMKHRTEFVIEVKPIPIWEDEHNADM